MNKLKLIKIIQKKSNNIIEKKPPNNIIQIKPNNKTTLTLKINSDHMLSSIINNYNFMQSVNQFIAYFLPNKYNYKLVGKNQKSDISIWDIHLNNNTHLCNDEINMLICVENVDHWKFYEHYKMYDNYKNNKMHLYLYNHIDRISKQNYLSIPSVHCYINYFLNNQNLHQPSNFTNFDNKRFCLLINRSDLNSDIQKIKFELEKIDEVDCIKMYTNLSKKSCYHSVELLNIFNNYKFIICYENSYKNGYVTEKIFNCFFAKTIPIYKGAPNIDMYFDKNSYIDTNKDNYIELIQLLNKNESMYNNYIDSNKISSNYNNENYNEEMINFIEKKLKKTFK